MLEEALTCILIICGLFVIVLMAFAFVANRCFDDNDPDLYPYDNYAVLDCPHYEKTDVTVSSNVTCETVHTICDACGKVLNVRTDC